MLKVVLAAETVQNLIAFRARYHLKNTHRSIPASVRTLLLKLKNGYYIDQKR